jgi:hypothetical protein
VNLRPLLIAANALVLLIAFGSAASQFFGLGWIGDKALADLAASAGLLVALACVHLLAVLACLRSARGTGGLALALLVAAPLTLMLLEGWLP